LAEIGAALGSGGTLQLFGCDVGRGDAGQQFVNDLAMYAGGINVAAATHDVGSAAYGGSWTLDGTAGPAASAPSPSGASSSPPKSAESAAPFSSQALNDFQGVLANPVVTELWLMVSGGASATELLHVDDNNGATSINNTTLWTPTSTNRPTAVSQVTDV